MRNIFITTGILITLAITGGISHAQNLPQWMQQSGWTTPRDICLSGRDIRESEYYGANCDEIKTMVTPKGMFPHWAGEIIGMYYDAGIRTFSKLKIKITWKTDRSPYQCGEIAIVPARSVKDFRFRSLQLHKC